MYVCMYIHDKLICLEGFFPFCFFHSLLMRPIYNFFLVIRVMHGYICMQTKLTNWLSAQLQAQTEPCNLSPVMLKCSAKYD